MRRSRLLHTLWRQNMTQDGRVCRLAPGKTCAALAAAAAVGVGTRVGVSEKLSFATDKTRWRRVSAGKT